MICLANPKVDFLQKAYASLMRANLEDLTAQADYIIIGNAVESKSHWNNEKTTIVTDVKVSIEEQIKGKIDLNEIIIRVIGGRVEDKTISSPEEPEFDIGKKAIFFMVKTTPGEYQIIGGFQGKYDIINDKVLGTDMTRQEFVSNLRKILEKGNKYGQ